jgi:DNA topoisomerase-3
LGTDIAGDAYGDENNEGRVPQNIAVGQTVNISNAITLIKYTEAPKLHTEATLLTAMQNAGSQIENGVILKGKGIGTQATRAGIIKKLFDDGYIANIMSKKTNFIKPTQLGVNFIKMLPQELYSPKITADWESKISAVADGDGRSEEILNDYKKFLDTTFKNAKNMYTENKYFSGKESVGLCPFCKQGEIYSEKGKGEKVNKEIDIYYCSLKCGFFLYTDDSGFFNHTGRLLLNKQVKQLISIGGITAKTKYNGKLEKFELIRAEKNIALIKLVSSKN